MVRLKQTSRVKGLKCTQLWSQEVCAGHGGRGVESAGAWMGHTDPDEGLQPEPMAVARLLGKGQKSLVPLREKHPAPPPETPQPSAAASQHAGRLRGPAPALGPAVLLRGRAPALSGTSVVKHCEYLLVLIPGTSEYVTFAGRKGDFAAVINLNI